MSGNAAKAGMEILRMNAGFRALPIDPDTKVPFFFLTPQGVTDATDDPGIFQQWMALASDAGLGIVPGPEFAILDDDTGDMDAGAFGLSGTFAERTRRGIHSWTRLPAGRRLRKSRLDGGDLITGHAAYAVMSPTPSYVPVDIEAPILTLPDDSPLWEIAAPRNPLATYASMVIMPEDEAAAFTLAERMRQSSEFGEGVAALLDGDTRWHRHFPTAEDRSRSGHDFQLAFAASHFLRENPRRGEIIFALLKMQSEKAAGHSSPDKYLQYVTHSAISARDTKDADRITALRLTTVTPGDVLDPTLRDMRAPRAMLVQSILTFASITDADDYARPGGWRRIPVADFARLHTTNPESVRRALCAAEDRGLIERHAPPRKHDGRIRRDSLVRLLHPCLAMAAA